jgi:thiol-disulfide isomerase/thioredoxin
MKPIQILLFLVISIQLQSQVINRYKITVVNKSVSKLSKLYVNYEYGGNEYTDSFNITNTKSVLTKKIAQPVAAIIYTNQKSSKSQKVFLSDEPVVLTIDGVFIKVKSSSLQVSFNQLIVNDEIRPTYFPLFGELSAKNDTAGLKKISNLFDSLKQNDIAKAYRYVKTNKQSALLLFAFQRYSSFKADYSVIEKDFLKLPFWVRNSPDGKLITQKIAGTKNGALGKAAINFVQRSASGDMFEFANYKGKYVLLDFWASWCVPCRKEHPGLTDLYKIYQSKNFEIISISLDDNQESWLQAILKDEMTWTNLSDLKGQQNEIAIIYGIQAIPANFLINPNGIIIAKNITAEELSAQLQQLIK